MVLTGVGNNIHLISVNLLFSNQLYLFNSLDRHSITMLSINSVALICVISGFLTSGKGEEEIHQVLQKCCKIGWDKAKFSKCETRKPMSDIEPDLQHFCFLVQGLCCAYARREIECEMGMDIAKSAATCLSVNSMDKEHCCQACELGLISSGLGKTCYRGKTSFGKLWDSAYLRCCEGTDNNKGLNGEIVAGKNMCLMLPDELCHHICIPTGESYKCTCNSGWTLMSDRKSCTPIDRNCIGCSDQDCKETATGELHCVKCPDQYHLDKGNKTCIPDEIANPALTCPYGFRNNANSNDETSICEDVNECIEDLSECDRNENCINTIGSYKCISKTPEVRCRRGFIFNSKIGSCIDIDECAETDDPPCDSNQNCINTNGSFDCECKTGFKQDEVTLACIDINECQQKTHNCVEYQRCDNTIGSYMCVRDINCGTGYTLNSQSGKCEDDDECTLGTDTCKLLGQEWECKNTQGSFRCIKKSDCVSHGCQNQQSNNQLCPSGYKVSGSTCMDIDECKEGIARCSSNQRCINIRGNYLCSDILVCKSGLKLNAEKTQCIDIDECSEQEGICSHYCDNLWGMYRCRCKPGYKLHVDNRTCIDINECDDGFKCQGYCINQQGSYACSCPPGYRTAGFKNQLCEDIDECKHPEKVCKDEEICINIAGSYRCNQINCPTGYRRDEVLKNRCQREDTRCLIGDLDCRRQPTTYSYNYITMVSNYTIPRGGAIKLFTISSTWTSTAPNFTFELVQARVPAGVKAATHSDFNLNKQYGKATIELVKSLIGPQEIQLEIKTEFYNGGMIIGTQISNLEIYVSMYTF